MIAMDRGIATKDNLALLKEMEFPYVIVERRAVEKEYKKEFDDAKETFEKFSPNKKEGQQFPLEVGLSESVYVKKVPIKKESRVLCLSQGFKKKVIAMDVLKENRFLHDQSRLQSSVEKGNIKLVGKAVNGLGD